MNMPSRIHFGKRSPAGRFCYMVELVASASMRGGEAVGDRVASLAQIPGVVGAGITSYAGGSAGHDPIRVADGRAGAAG